MQGEDFKQTCLSDPATTFAKRLFDIMEKISSIDQMADQVPDVMEQLENVFFHALTIKYEIMLSQDRFELIWPAFGSPFEDDSMTVHQLAPPKARSFRTEDGAATVQLTIVPGLRCHPTLSGPTGLICEKTLFLAVDEPHAVNPIMYSKAIVSI